MATGDLTAAIRTDGWSADVTIEGRAAWLGAVTYDFGTPGSTSTSKFYLNVTSEGYNSSGTLGTIARTAYGSKAVRMPTGTKAIPGTLSGTFTDGETITQAVSGATGKVYGASQGATHGHLIYHTETGTPNATDVWTGGTSGQTCTPSGAPASRTTDERVVGSDLVVRVALTAQVYDDDKNGGAGTSGTNPKLYATAGWASSGGNNSNAASNVDCTNNSTADYPTAFGQWDPHAGLMHRMRTKTNYTLAFNAFHGHGVACVLFNSVGGTSAVDQSGYVTRQTKTQRSATSRYGWAHHRTVTLSAFTQGETITNRARVYPKVGDANSVFDTSGKTTAGEECRGYNEHVTICDKSDALDVIRYVSTTGNDTTGDGTSGNPWATISKATTTAGVNVVKLMGTGTTYDTGSAATRKTTSEWVIVEPDTGATPTVRFTTTVNYRVERLMFRNVPIIPNTTGSYLSGESLNYVAFVGCAFSRNAVGNSTASPGYRSLCSYYINCTGDLSATAWAIGVNSTNLVASVFDGCVFASGGTQLDTWYRVACCKCDGKAPLRPFANTITAMPIQNNVVVAWNKFTGGSTWSGTIALDLGTQNAQEDVAIVGNIFEKVDGTGQGWRVCGDGAAYAADNFIIAHNTVAPAADTARVNLFYNDTGTTAVPFTNIFLIGNDFGRTNIKSDTFATASAARTGNWAQLYGVNFRYDNHDSTTGFPWEFGGIGYTTATGTYVNSGTYDYTPDTGSALLDQVDYSATPLIVDGDAAGHACSVHSSALACQGALQPVPTLAVTVDGEAAAEDATVDIGQQSAGASIDVVATVSGLTGATVYIEDYATDAGIAEVAEFVPEYITVGGTTTNTATLRLEQGASTAAITITSSYGDGSFLVTLEWEEQSAGAVSALGDGGGWGKIVGQ